MYAVRAFPESPLPYLPQLRYGKNRIARNVIDENKIVGTIALRKLTTDVAELKRFFVLQKYQGKGYGQELINVLTERAPEGGYSFLRLDTTSKSDKAIHLFRKNGFYEISRYNDDPFAEIFMELNLKTPKQR